MNGAIRRAGLRGKKPARHGAVKYKFRDIFDPGDLPPVTWPFGRTSYFTEDDGPDALGMLGNDEAGCCAWSGAAHEEMLWGALHGTGAPKFTKGNVLADYSAVTGFDPRQWIKADDDNPTDQGTDLVTMATYRQKTGIIDASGHRHKIDGFVSIEVGNFDEVALAAFLFGAVGIGALLPSDAEDQFDANVPWTLSRARKGDGHYFPVVAGDHTGANLVCVTWGRYQGITRPWLESCMDEGLVYISKAALRKNTLLTQRGMNWDLLFQAFGKF